MRSTLVLLPLVAACAATTPKDLEKLPIAEVCYLSMSDSGEKEMALAEVNRRRVNCQDHMAEIKKIQDLEARAGGSTPGVSVESGASKSSGGMGRGY